MAGKRTRTKQLAAPPADEAIGAPVAERQADAAWAAEAPVRSVESAPVGEASPSMAQFLDIKAANPDSLLWYRMGDFYELFFDDAVAASATLGIVLTKRGKHMGQDIPMCGVPIHRADEYLQRLIKAGHRVAVAEQLEDPAEARKRGAKAVVRRDVVRLVTPGTITEDTLLDSKARNYLTALFRAGGHGESGVLQAQTVVGLASIDISTGEFEVGEVSGTDLPGELARLSPGEVIVPDALLADAELRAWIGRVGAAATPVPGAYFDSFAGEANLKKQLKVSELGGFGSFTRPELAAIGAALKYVELTQMGRAPSLRAPKRSGSDAILLIDAASRASLELVRSVSGEKHGTLLAAIDRTVTGAGARELAARLASPLRDVARINCRLDAVGFLIDQETLRADLHAALKSAPDIARAVSRLGFGRGSPRDLAAVRDGLAAASRCADLLADEGAGMGLPEELGRVFGELRAVDAALQTALAAALVDDPPHLKRDGGFVRQGYRSELDEARRLKEDGRSVMAGLEAQYVARTGVKSLKVRHNNILGFFIEVTQGNAKPLLEAPLSAEFRHRQTMANAVRFSTTELIDIEGRIASASERALSFEQEIFAELAAAIEREHSGLGRIAAALAELDATAGLAELARTESYARPVVDSSPVFEIRGGRHPVVEQALKAAKAGAFIENDCVLGGGEASNGRGHRRWTHLAGHRTEHGRQVDVLAPERSHRRAGADGLVRAGAIGDNRRARPPVQPRRRLRRPGARALDLHGRDGRDRGHPQSGERPVFSHSRRDRTRHGDLRRPVDRLGDGGVPTRRARRPRPVCHALPRADGARPPPRRGRQRDHRRARVARRDRLPAQGQAGGGRSLVWYSGCQTGRAARSGGGPGARGADVAGEDREPQACA